MIYKWCWNDMIFSVLFLTFLIFQHFSVLFLFRWFMWEHCSTLVPTISSHSMQQWTNPQQSNEMISWLIYFIFNTYQEIKRQHRPFMAVFICPSKCNWNVRANFPSFHNDILVLVSLSISIACRASWTKLHATHAGTKFACTEHHVLHVYAAKLVLFLWVAMSNTSSETFLQKKCSFF